MVKLYDVGVRMRSHVQQGMLIDVEERGAQYKNIQELIKFIVCGHPDDFFELFCQTSQQNLVFKRGEVEGVAYIEHEKFIKKQADDLAAAQTAARAVQAVERAALADNPASAPKTECCNSTQSSGTTLELAPTTDDQLLDTELKEIVEATSEASGEQMKQLMAEQLTP